ncbi:MAG: FG-GAP repeat protein [Planctomycetes bacterium]|nr:FG-GAP repeat protein [Planctomycetota bacterium]
MNRSPGCSQDVLRLAGPIIIAMAVLSPAARGQCAANELAKLTASDGALGDFFGSSVSISGDTAIVGARNVDDDCPSPNPPQIPADINCGAAYIFQVDADGTWVQVARLTGADAEAYDKFGNAVSISGDTAIVGAHRSNEADILSGSVSIFRRDFGGPDNWGEVVELVGSDTGAFDFFGWSVAISGDTAIVGAPFHDEAVPNIGSAYIFRRDAGGPGNWGQVAELTALDAAGADFFGWSVAISGPPGNEIALVGAWGNDDDDNNAIESGSAYIFQRDFGGPDNWGQVAKLTASDPHPLDSLGANVAVSGDIAFVGAPGTDDATGEPHCNSGSVYIFQRDFGGPDNWGEVLELIPSDNMCGDVFGGAVALSGVMAVVGAPADDTMGSAYIFQRDLGGPDNWGEAVKLTASDAALSDNFGGRVSLDGETAIIAAVLNDDNGSNSGSAYVIGGLSDCNNNGVLDLCDIADGDSDDDNNNGIPDECECPWDLNANGSVGVSDLLSLLASWGPCKGCPADFDGDGTVGILDLLALLANWGECI